MNNPYDPPLSALVDKSDSVRLRFVFVLLVSLAFSAFVVGSNFLPTEPVLQLLFPNASFFNMQPVIETATLVACFVSVIWCIIYFVVSRILKSGLQSIKVSCFIVGFLQLALIFSVDTSSPIGRPDFNIAILNSSIGLIAGSFASLAVARYFHRRATA